MNVTQDNYFILYSSKADAWEYCQDIYWLFVMLDDSGYSNSVACTLKLRQYACQIARSYWHLLDQTAREFIQDLERLLNKRISKAGGELTTTTLTIIERSSIGTKEKLQYAANIAINVVDQNIPSNVSAALATKYAFKLGANEEVLVETLKNLIGNPYLLNFAPIIRRNWWQVRKSRNVLDLVGNWLNSLLDVEQEQVKDFDSFLNSHGSLAAAWESSPRVDWMLAILDLYSNYARTSEAQGKFRQFVCWLAREDTYFDTTKVHESVKIAVEIAEHFAYERATLKDLKLAEIAVTEAIRNCNFRGVWVTELALLSTYQSAWVAILQASRYDYKLSSAIKLRELVSNPFF